MRRIPWLRLVVLAYLAALIALPLFFIFQQALAHGLRSFLAALGDHSMGLAIALTAKVALVAVPANAVVGLGAALWIVRRPTRLSRALDRVIDIPLAVSPIVIGLVLELAYGPTGWLGRPLAELGLKVMFSLPGIVLASMVVSLPLVSRQVIPLLRAAGVHQEQTAATLGASPARVFVTITLRSVTWALVYGVTLTFARVIGEYGAVLIVSGNIADVTQTLTLNIGANFDNFDAYQGFVGAVVLAVAALAVLALLGVARHRERRQYEHLA